MISEKNIENTIFSYLVFQITVYKILVKSNVKALLLDISETSFILFNRQNASILS